MAVIYDSIMEGAQLWPIDERRELILAVSEYMQFGMEPDLDTLSPFVAGAFMMIKPSLDSSKSAAENGSKGGKKRAENARNKGANKGDSKPTTKGACKGVSKGASKHPSKRNPSEEEEEEELKKPSADALGKESGRRFRKPTAAEVDAYIAERGYGGFTGQQFVDHYEANGWMVGRNRMRDWRAAVRTWQSKRSRGMPRGQPRPTLVDFGAYDLRSEEA